MQNYHSAENIKQTQNIHNFFTSELCPCKLYQFLVIIDEL